MNGHATSYLPTFLAYHGTSGQWRFASAGGTGGEQLSAQANADPAAALGQPADDDANGLGTLSARHHNDYPAPGHTTNTCHASAKQDSRTG